MMPLCDWIIAALLFWTPGDARALRGLERAIVDAPWQEARYDPTPGSSHTRQLAQFEHFLKTELHVTINYVPREAIRPQADAAGATSEVIRFIRIEQDLLANGRLEVLAHEAAHLLQPPLLDMRESEWFAESVSYLVCRRLGLNTRRQAARYLASYKSALATGRYYRADVIRAVKRLVSWR